MTGELVSRARAQHASRSREDGLDHVGPSIIAAPGILHAPCSTHQDQPSSLVSEQQYIAAVDQIPLLPCCPAPARATASRNTRADGDAHADIPKCRMCYMYDIDTISIMLMTMIMTSERTDERRGHSHDYSVNTDRDP